MINLKTTPDLESKISMGELVAKAGLYNLHKLNKVALLGILLEAKRKLESPNKKIRKEIVQHYTNIGVQEFKINI